MVDSKDSKTLLNKENEGDLTEEAETDCEYKKITLWRSPVRTVYYFGRQLYIELCKLYEYAKEHKGVLSSVCLLLTVVVLFLNVPGPQHQYVVGVNKQIVWYLWWVGLGILSSIGLGTGLHTFLLYLGPHIATVTIAAWECSSTEFPEPPYPDVVICPRDAPQVHITMWTILNKVRIESLMWGVGTAIGELPPYFMARAARLSGEELDDAEYKELQNLEDKSELGCRLRLKLFVQKLVQKAGFFGILLCASIPNPLFDLAGVTCGYMLIPFLTFFSATLIGKSIFKTHIQMVMVIFIFTQDNMSKIEEFSKTLPDVIHKPFVHYMEQQRETLHDSTALNVKEGTTLLSVLFNLLVFLMVLFFLLSIVNSMAQQNYRAESLERYRLIKSHADSD